MYWAFINNKEAGGIYKKCFSERAGAAVLGGAEEQLDKKKSVWLVSALHRSSRA